MMPTVLVDCNSICHRVRHTMGGLSYNEQSVGIIFGFLRQLQATAKRLSTNKFVFCWDARSRKRSEIYPQYKANRHREKTDEETEIDSVAYSQFTKLRKEILPKIGFKNIFHAEGFESDDIIAKIVKDNGHRFVIVSTDSDLYQLLSADVSMLIANDKPLFTADSLWQKHLVTPDQWPLIKAIAGCSADNVAGIVGVGEKTAAKYMRNELLPTSKSYKSITNNATLIMANFRLVHLPFEGIHSFTLVRDKLSFDGFLEVCNEHGFYSLISKDSRNLWKNLFFS